MTSDVYSREYYENINKKNQYTINITPPANINENKNLSKILYNRRNNSSDIRRKNNNIFQQNNADNNDNDHLLSKLVTQAPKNNIKNQIRSLSGGLVQDPKYGNDAMK